MRDTGNTNPSLSDRYLNAVVRGVRQEDRMGVAESVSQSIETAVRERVSRGEAPDDAERRVLREMGDPLGVAAAASGRSLVLIGPRLYPGYIRLLKLLLSIVVPIVTVVVGVTTALAGADLWNVLLSALGTGFNVGVQLSFWVTLVFAVIERRGTSAMSLTDEWDVEDLPDLPDARIGLGDTLSSITGLALLTVLLLWQPGYQESWEPGGDSTPILDPGLSAAWIPALVIVLLASITVEIVKFNVGRWTVPLAAINTVLSLAFAVPVLYLIATDQLLNPEFVTVLVENGWSSLPDLILTLAGWVIAAVCVFDIAEGWWKALVSERSRILVRSRSE